MCFSNVDLQAVFRFEVVLTLVTLENFLHSIISGSQGDINEVGSAERVSKENAKVEPMVTEKVKDLFWLASAWQKSMHWEAKEESTEAIFLFI